MLLLYMPSVLRVYDVRELTYQSLPNQQRNFSVFHDLCVMLLLRLGFLVHGYASARDAMPEERLIIVVVFCSVCEPRAVIRIRVRGCVVRVRIDETAIRVGVVIRATNDTARWKPLTFYIILFKFSFLYSF